MSLPLPPLQHSNRYFFPRGFPTLLTILGRQKYLSAKTNNWIGFVPTCNGVGEDQAPVRSLTTQSLRLLNREIVLPSRSLLMRCIRCVFILCFPIFHLPFPALQLVTTKKIAAADVPRKKCGCGVPNFYHLCTRHGTGRKKIQPNFFSRFRKKYLHFSPRRCEEMIHGVTKKTFFYIFLTKIKLQRLTKLV